MNSQKKMWILLVLAVISMVILSGCGGIKTAKLNISIDPNPVPYSSEDGKWYFTMDISESNGVGVTVTSLTFTGFNQEDELTGTQILDAEEFYDWFETDYISAFSTVQTEISYSGTSVYSIVRVAGIDDNGNPVEATVRIDYLPQ